MVMIENDADEDADVDIDVNSEDVAKVYREQRRREAVEGVVAQRQGAGADGVTFQLHKLRSASAT